MKKEIVAVLSVLVLFTGCPSGTDPTADPAGTVSPDIQAAITALQTGDVTTAQSQYDAALKADPTDTTAAFGAAITRFMLITQWTPSQNLLADFQQNPLPVSNIVGPSGYLAAFKKFNDGKMSPASPPNSSSSAALEVGDPDPADYLPFAGYYALSFRRGFTGKMQGVLESAKTGLESTEVLSNFALMTPLFEDIRDLLQKADKKDDFQFVIPKELYFGTKDVTLNRIDLKAIRADVSFTLTALHLLNSWNLSIPLQDSKSFVTNRNRQEVVDQLNQFFTLKSPNELKEAATELASALQSVLDSSDLMKTVTTDGVLESNVDAQAGYDEIQALMTAIQSSLKGQQTFTFVNPNINLNFDAFFTTPPDATSINIDPFVLEQGQFTSRVRPVEAFFEQLLSQTLNLDFKQQYRHAFSALGGKNNIFLKTVFDEFQNFSVAGVTLGKTP